MPETERDLFNTLKEIYLLAKKLELEPICYLEKVHCMPGEGVKSVWTFSGNYHGIRMALISLFIPIRDITPMTWQKRLNLTKSSPSVPKKDHKNNLKAAAQQLYPNINVTLWNADALLIASYGVLDSSKLWE